MTRATSTLGKFFSALSRIYRVFRAIILNGLFLLLVILFAASLIGEAPFVIQPGSALLVNPDGVLVEQYTYVDPMQALLADSLDNAGPREVLVAELLDAISEAAVDDRISSLVLVLNNLQPSGFSKLRDVAKALTDFRKSGKPIYAYGDNFTQAQYYLAAHADEVILNTMGSVDLEGFSTNQIYYRDALEKLGINVHIFRVGEYKSAVEPFERMDMSSQARESNSEWLADLWSLYTEDVSRERELSPDFINDFINNMDTHLAVHDGNPAVLALANGLVDNLLSRPDTTRYLRSAIAPAPDSDDFLYVDTHNYLQAQSDPVDTVASDHIGLIIARGTIYDGRQEAGNIGGDTLQELIHRAGQDERIKALVLRIDSGGGSAFASEIIRSELLRFRETGKPLVVSMSSVAASGGYWIATAADEIFASPGTITGSIGIFGLYPTFEKSFQTLGLAADGIGTTDLAGSMTPGMALSPLAENILQLTLEDGYRRFIEIVAESRQLSLDAVNRIARGRVWSGLDAREIGLVDRLGTLEDAIEEAASRAGIDFYQTTLIKRTLSPGEQLIQELANNVMSSQWFSFTRKERGFLSSDRMLSQFSRVLGSDLGKIFEFNDPNNLYLHCQECSAAVLR